MEKSNQFVEELYVEPKKEEILVSFLQIFEYVLQTSSSSIIPSKKKYRKKEVSKIHKVI